MVVRNISVNHFLYPHFLNMLTSGLLVVFRSYESLKKDSRNFNSNEVSYRGFDGWDYWIFVEDWDKSLLERGFPNKELVSIEKFEIVLSYFKELQYVFGTDVDLLYVGEINEKPLLPAGFRFIGYDFGVVWEKDIYGCVLFSSIWGERWFGSTGFDSQLNEFFLIDSLEKGNEIRLSRLKAWELNSSALESAYEPDAYRLHSIYLFEG